MDDYVSRQWLLTEYDKRHKGPPGGARKMIEEAPPADVRPVKKGHWIIHKKDLFPEASTIECDQCHAEQTIWIDANFCPNCGAKMGGTDGRQE